MTMGDRVFVSFIATQELMWTNLIGYSTWNASAATVPSAGSPQSQVRSTIPSYLRALALRLSLPAPCVASFSGK